MLNSLSGKRKKNAGRKSEKSGEGAARETAKKKLDCKKNEEMDGVKANELSTVA